MIEVVAFVVFFFVRKSFVVRLFTLTCLFKKKLESNFFFLSSKMSSYTVRKKFLMKFVNVHFLRIFLSVKVIYLVILNFDELCPLFVF